MIIMFKGCYIKRNMITLSFSVQGFVHETNLQISKMPSFIVINRFCIILLIILPF